MGEIKGSIPSTWYRVLPKETSDDCNQWASTHRYICFYCTLEWAIIGGANWANCRMRDLARRGSMPDEHTQLRNVPHGPTRTKPIRCKYRISIYCR